MDGVLADVTHSQHQAIIQTAAKYGVIVDESDIGQSQLSPFFLSQIMTVSPMMTALLTPSLLMHNLTFSMVGISSKCDHHYEMFPDIFMYSRHLVLAC